MRARAFHPKLSFFNQRQKSKNLTSIPVQFEASTLERKTLDPISELASVRNLLKSIERTCIYIYAAMAFTIQLYNYVRIKSNEQS